MAAHSHALAPDPGGRLRAGRRLDGFTQLELVVVLVVVGILAAVAIPRLLDRTVFDTRGHADRVGGIVRFAQQSAIAQRRNVCVAVSGGAVTVQKAAAPGAGVACGMDLVDPTTGSPFSAAVPSASVTVTASLSPIIFDALGQSVDGAGAPRGTDATITIASADLTVTVTVEKVSGYVH